MKNQSNRLDKIRALANAGIDGEKSNAQSILEKLTKGQPNEKPILVEVDTVIFYGANRGKTESYSFEQLPTLVHIHLPYKDFVFQGTDAPPFGQPDKKAQRIWRRVCTLGREIIERETGSITVQNHSDRITCRCYPVKEREITTLVEAAVYDFLIEQKVPVIHNGGDKAGFSVKNDSMEDGTENSIYQYQMCQQFEAPNRDAEIFSAMALPKYNKFVAITKEQATWGKLTEHNKDAGTITVTPLNPAYAPAIVTLSEIIHLYRVESWGHGWNCISDTELQPVKERKARNETKKLK